MSQMSDQRGLVTKDGGLYDRVGLGHYGDFVKVSFLEEESWSITKGKEL